MSLLQKILIPSNELNYLCMDSPTHNILIQKEIYLHSLSTLFHTSSYLLHTSSPPCALYPPLNNSIKELNLSNKS